KGGTSSLPWMEDAVVSVGTTELGGGDVDGAIPELGSKTTGVLLPPELPRIANTMAPMLARPMRPAAANSAVRPLPRPSSRGGGCGMAAGVGNDTLLPMGVWPW